MRHAAVTPAFLFAALMLLWPAAPVAAKPTDAQLAAIKYRYQQTGDKIGNLLLKNL